MKPSVIMGFTLICLYALLSAFETFFPESGTTEQKFNVACLAAASLISGMGLLIYSRKKGYKIL